MTLRYIPFLLLTAFLVGGCSSGDSAASATDVTKSTDAKPVDVATAAKPASPVADVAKPADASTPAETKPTLAEPAKSKPADAAKSPSYSIIGSWTSDEPSVHNRLIIFSDQGKMTMSGYSPNGHESVVATASFTQSGNTISYKVSSVKMSAMPGATDKEKKEVEDGNKLAASALKKQLADTASLEWTDKDTVTMTLGKGADTKVTTLKRKTS
jgi:hypothetical protein